MTAPVPAVATAVASPPLDDPRWAAAAGLARLGGAIARERFRRAHVAWKPDDSMPEAGARLTTPEGADVFPVAPPAYAGAALAILAGDPGAHRQARDEVRAAARSGAAGDP